MKFMMYEVTVKYLQPIQVPARFPLHIYSVRTFFCHTKKEVEEEIAKICYIQKFEVKEKEMDCNICRIRNDK